MKKTVSILLSLVMLFSLCALLFSCSSGGAGGTGNAEPSIVFGKRYMEYKETTGELSNERSYTFNANGTGYYDFDYTADLFDFALEATVTYIYKGRIHFVWRAVADGSVALFPTETVYDESHTEGKTEFLKRLPLTLGDDFLFELTTGGSTTRYIVEGSSLANALAK